MRVRLLLCGLLLTVARGVAAVPDQITLFLPAFQSTSALGQNVATVLNLQIWSTLRRKPWPDNPDNLDFGRGLIVWDPNSLHVQSHREAEKVAKSISVLAQMVLWGKAYPYGDGVVVQANMSIPQYRDFREHNNEIWQVEYRGRTIRVDIPRRRFEVSSIVLARDVIEQYSLPSALEIYDERQGGEPKGSVGSFYRGIQFEPQLGLAKVEAGELVGWVRLPQLGKNRSEISAFVGGVMKVFRSDWEGALKAMERVIENKQTRTPLRIDAHLYAGMALERLGRSGRGHFEQAMVLNPYARRTVEYLLMSDVAALERLGDPNHGTDHAQTIARRLETNIDAHARLFPENDEWLHTVRSIVR